MSKRKKTMKQWFDILNKRRLSGNKITISEMRELMKHQDSSSINPIDEMLSAYIDIVVRDPEHEYNWFTSSVLFTEEGDKRYSIATKFGKDSSRHNVLFADKVAKVEWFVNECREQAISDIFEWISELDMDLKITRFESKMIEFLSKQPQLLIDSECFKYQDSYDINDEYELYDAASDLSHDLIHGNIVLDKFPNNLIDKANTMVDALVQSHIDWCP